MSLSVTVGVRDKCAYPPPYVAVLLYIPVRIGDLSLEPNTATRTVLMQTMHAGSRQFHKEMRIGQ